MSKDELFKKLQDYKSVMDLNRPVDINTLTGFEASNKVFLLIELKELLLMFNGGEIFIPGTRIYGIEIDDKNNAKFANRSSLRSKFHIPPNYLIFAKVNYGDFLCVNLNSPFDVIQWDHECDEQFCFWNSISEWLEATITEYQKYETGDV